MLQSGQKNFGITVSSPAHTLPLSVTTVIPQSEKDSGWISSAIDLQMRTTFSPEYSVGLNGGPTNDGSNGEQPRQNTALR